MFFIRIFIGVNYKWKLNRNGSSYTIVNRLKMLHLCIEVYKNNSIYFCKHTCKL